jgi:hypothetical protein
MSGLKARSTTNEIYFVIGLALQLLTVFAALYNTVLVICLNLMKNLYLRFWRRIIFIFGKHLLHHANIIFFVCILQNILVFLNPFLKLIRLFVLNKSMITFLQALFCIIRRVQRFSFVTRKPHFLKHIRSFCLLNRYR